MSAVTSLLTLELLPQVDAFLAERRQLLGRRAPSEYAFPNLYLFRHTHAYRFHATRLPWIAGRTYDGVDHALPLVPPDCMTPSDLDAMFDNCACLYPLPAQDVAYFDPDRYRAEAMRDDADYLYPVENFLHYRGDRLRRKRQAVDRLRAAHEVESVALDRANMAEARCVLEGWMADKDKAAGSSDDGPCCEALSLLAELGMQGWLHRVDRRPAGFVIVQLLAPDTLVVRFAKGRTDVPGIYPWMFRHLAIQRPLGVKWINFEQDLGNPGFRRSKLSFEPAAIMDKYRLYRRR